MHFVLGNLPDGVNEQELTEFLGHFCAVKNVVFFDGYERRTHSDYECVAEINVVSPIQGSSLQNRLNNYCWKGRCIHSHRLLF